MLEKVQNKTFSESYQQLLSMVMNYPDYETKPRGKAVKEKMNISYRLDNPLSCLYENKIRTTPEGYLKGELIWYFAGNNEVEFISKYSKFWTHITNPDNKTVNSAYGNLIFERENKWGYSPWDWAWNSLVKDKHSRQALLHFNTPDHAFPENKDFVCTLTGLFNIRNNKLNLTITQRSCDMIRGLTFDTPFFVLLQYFMWKELQYRYENLELGWFCHFINSLHIYNEHYELVSNMLEEDFISRDIITPDIELSKLRKQSKDIVAGNAIKSDSKFLNWLIA